MLSLGAFLKTLMFLPCQVPLSFKINVSCIFKSPSTVKKIQALQGHQVMLRALAVAQGLKASVSLTYFSLNMEFFETVRPQRLTWVKRKSLVKTGEFMLGTKNRHSTYAMQGKKTQNPKWTNPKPNTHTANLTCGCHTEFTSQPCAQQVTETWPVPYMSPGDHHHSLSIITIPLYCFLD